MIWGGTLEKKYLTVMEATVFLKLARSTIYSYVHFELIPYIKLGERVLFDEADLIKWIDKKKKGVHQKTK